MFYNVTRTNKKGSNLKIQYAGYKPCLMCPGDKVLNLKLYMCLFVCLVDWKHQASIPKCAYPLSDTPTHNITKHTHQHHTQPICSPVDLQIVFAAPVQLAPLQSTIEHIPCLCFLYRPIKIFPPMASLLQVGESEILCLDNELTPSYYFSAKHSINHSDAISSIPTVCVHVFNRLEADASFLKKSDLQDNSVP